MGEHTSDVGAGLVSIQPRPYVNEPTYYVGQLWASRRMSESLKLSGIIALDRDAAAGGTSLAWLPVRGLVTAGVEAELGYAWAALGLPMSLALYDDFLTVYSTPRLGTWGSTLTPSVPLGLSIDLAASIELRAEVQVSWPDFLYYNRRVQGGLALAYQFDEVSK